MIVPATQENIRSVALRLISGEPVAIPTETVYGLAADATNETAVKKIFELKNRPSFNPLIVHISSMEALKDVANLEADKRAADRASRLSPLWPAPLSMVLPKQARICPAVTAGLPTVAVRMPRHPVALKIIEAAGVPLAAPSANLFTTVSPTTAKHVQDSFGDRLPLIIDGGPCEVGLESTIVSLVNDTVEVLRPGSVTVEMLQNLLGEKVSLRKGAVHGPCPELLAPGMLKVHYAPKTPVAFRENLVPQKYPARTGLISFREEAGDNMAQWSKVVLLSKSGDLSEIAARLFAALRELDSAGLDLIVVDTCPEEGLGMAIMDRLRRAAARGRD